MRMKRTLFSIVLLAVFAVQGLYAQATREEIFNDIATTGGVYYAYPGPSGVQTKAPKGYEPFYISHYGRHGSRWLIADEDYVRVMEVFEKAHAAGALTDLGEDVRKRLDIVWADAKGHGGDLSPVGVKQQRGIAERMYQAFPEVFKGEPQMSARSTVVIRCVLSMDAFCERLKEFNPKMRIERVQASAHKKGRVLVFLEDGACLKITEQEALDFGLRTGDDLDGRRLEQLKKAASVSDVKATAADLIGKRAMSRRDLERKLQEKGASQAEARYAAEWLEAIGAINDADYAAILVRHCAGLGYGPARIREKLREKGVPRELWDEALDQAPDSAWQIDRFLAAKLRGRAPEEAEKRRLTSALLRRGFAWGDVREAWSRLGAEILEE